MAIASVIIVYNHLIPHLDIFLSSTQARVTLLLMDNLLQSSTRHPLIHLFYFRLGSSSSSQGNQLVDTVHPFNIVTILRLQSQLWIFSLVLMIASLHHLHAFQHVITIEREILMVVAHLKMLSISGKGGEKVGAKVTVH